MHISEIFLYFVSVVMVGRILSPSMMEHEALIISEWEQLYLWFMMG